MHKITDRKGLKASEWFADVLNVDWLEAVPPAEGVSVSEFSLADGYDYHSVVNEINLTFERCVNEFDGRRADSDGIMAAGIHRAMPHLTRREASDPDFWAYLACFGCIRYVKWRWNSEKVHAFFDHCAGQVRRNALARLWWWADITTRPDNVQDQYAVTEIVQGRQNLLLWFVDCAFSGNRAVAQALHDLQQRENLDRDDQIRICRNINRIAQTICIDGMPESALDSICQRTLQMP